MILITVNQFVMVTSSTIYTCNMKTLSKFSYYNIIDWQACSDMTANIKPVYALHFGLSFP